MESFDRDDFEWPSGWDGLEPVVAHNTATGDGR
jgi:hypothetical protein